MASKKSKPKMKHYPVVRSMMLSQATPVVPASVEIVDVGRCLSQINRRLYRYGRYYEVKIDLEADSNTSFAVYALRDDWAVQKGFQLAYNAYLKNSKDEREHMSSKQIARWEDFRAVSGLTGEDAGPVLWQGSTPRELVLQGEFNNTSVVDELGTQRSFRWVGATSGTTYNILEEYDKAGNAQSAPSSTVTGNELPYGQLTDEIDGLMANNLENFGNEPPYERDGVNSNGPFVRIATLNASSPNAQRLSTGFFTAPCGLVYVVKLSTESIQNKWSLTVKAGDYKGVHAPSMLE